MSTYIERVKAAESSFPVLMKFVYMWMTFGLFLSGYTAYFIGNTPEIYTALFSNNIYLIGLIIVEFGLVIALSSMLHKLNYMVSALMFCLFSVINGATLSSIFIIYEMSSIFSVFFITAGTFLTMCLIGLFTKKDLTKIGGILIMCLIGLIIAGLVNLFMQSTMFDFMISCIGVVVFCGLTMYDAQKIKENLKGLDDVESNHKYAIYCALDLYLDFVNLFLYLLKLFGSKK